MHITVCIGSACYIKGSRSVIQEFEAQIDSHQLKDQITLNGSFCMGNCVQGVSVKVDEQLFSLKPGEVEVFFEKEVMSKLES